PAEELAAYQADSEQRPGEEHGVWRERVARLEAELLGRHPRPVPGQAATESATPAAPEADQVPPADGPPA
ncbi:MAG: hypothetical protein ACYDEN_11375, partial [Acidimicrobiales bacterium]